MLPAEVEVASVAAARQVLDRFGLASRLEHVRQFVWRGGALRLQVDDASVWYELSAQWVTAVLESVVVDAQAGEGAVDVQRGGKGDGEKAVEQEDGRVGDPLLNHNVVAAEPYGDEEHHHQHGSELFEVLTGVQDVVPARARASIFGDRGTRHARNCSGDGWFSLNSILRRQRLG